MPNNTVKFRIFKRRWWNKGPGGVLVPHASRGTTITYIRGEEAARAYCQAYNAVNLPKHNPLAIRAEYEGA